MVSLPEPKYPPDLPPFRYFAHFVLFFREANEMTPEEKAAKNGKTPNVKEPGARGSRGVFTQTKISPKSLLFWLP